jgi:hypothetical protein
MKRSWTVRLIWGSTDPRDRSGLLLEQLRYAGHVRILAERADYQIVEIPCPKGLNDKVWSEQNAARMKSFGLNAVPAPQWAGEPLTSAQIAEATS